MDLAVDLHSHSIFAGGTQSVKLSQEKKSLNQQKAISHLRKINETMPLKGIDLVGTGDCQFTIWTDILKEWLQEETSGVFVLKDKDSTKFILQTELIFTAPIGKKSKIAHIVLLFPDFNAVETFRNFLDKWGVKHEKMARPFLRCQSPNQVSDRINAIMDIDSCIEVIPAHIMTPQGIFGSNIRINHLNEFFGSVGSELRVFETGLSADPAFLALIPELDNRVFISNSDAHSSALHRMGREFTVLSISKFNYSSIISALRTGKIQYTAEFPPEEGRFFLTGHRAGRKSPGIHGDDEFCYFSPKYVPQNDICPICFKSLTIGMYQRCIEISRAQGVDRNINSVYSRNKFIRMVPLVDIISHVLNIKTKTAKTVINKYHQIYELIGPERNLWQKKLDDIVNNLTNHIDNSILDAIIQVKSGNFTFNPCGYDGNYGCLTIGEKSNYNNISIIHSSKPIQKTL